MKVLLETGTRVSEFVVLRVQNVSLTERVIVTEGGVSGKGDKPREVPTRPELARLVPLHVGRRRSGPLVVNRQKRSDGRPPSFTHPAAHRSDCTPDCPGHRRRQSHLSPLASSHHANRLLDITNVQKFLRHEDITTIGTCAETSAAALRHKFDQISGEAGNSNFLTNSAHYSISFSGRQMLEIGFNCAPPLIHTAVIIPLWNFRSGPSWDISSSFRASSMPRTLSISTLLML